MTLFYRPKLCTFTEIYSAINNAAIMQLPIPPAFPPRNSDSSRLIKPNSKLATTYVLYVHVPKDPAGVAGEFSSPVNFLWWFVSQHPSHPCHSDKSAGGRLHTPNPVSTHSQHKLLLLLPYCLIFHTYFPWQCRGLIFHKSAKITGKVMVRGKLPYPGNSKHVYILSLGWRTLRWATLCSAQFMITEFQPSTAACTCVTAVLSQFIKQTHTVISQAFSDGILNSHSPWLSFLWAVKHQPAQEHYTSVHWQYNGQH